MRLVQQPLNSFSIFERFADENPKIWTEDLSEFAQQAVDYLIAGDKDSRLLAFSCMEKLVLLTLCKRHGASFIEELKSKDTESVEEFKAAFGKVKDRCEARAAETILLRREQQSSAEADGRLRHVATSNQDSTQRHAHNAPTLSQTSADRPARQAETLDSQFRRERPRREHADSSSEQYRETLVDSRHERHAIEPHTTSTGVPRIPDPDSIPDRQPRGSSGRLIEDARDRHHRPLQPQRPRDSGESVNRTTHDTELEDIQEDDYPPRSRHLPDTTAPRDGTSTSTRDASASTPRTTASTRRTSISTRDASKRPLGAPASAQEASGIAVADRRGPMNENVPLAIRSNRHQNSSNAVPESKTSKADTASQVLNDPKRHKQQAPSGGSHARQPAPGGGQDPSFRGFPQRPPGPPTFRATRTPTLDPAFQAIAARDWDNYFRRGRVFAALRYSEDTRADEHSLWTTVDRFGHRIHTHVNRMVIVGRGRGHCWAIPINTYQKQGLQKPGLSHTNIQAHAIIHMDNRTPMWLLGEPHSSKRPIKVHPEDPSKELHEASRLNFEKVHTVELNVRILKIGTVASESLPFLKDYFEQEMHRVARTPS